MDATACRRFHPLPAIAAIGAALAFTACVDEGPSAPELDLALRAEPAAEVAALPASAEMNRTLAELRRATAPYHNVDVALADGFVQVTECEERPGEGVVGIVYVDLDRVDAIVDPSQPEGLIYEPAKNGKLKLVGVEPVIPFDLWTGEDPPEFFGVPFQPEEEFGVWGLHVWIWRHNPDGMFAVSNPRVTCEPTS